MGIGQEDVWVRSSAPGICTPGDDVLEIRASTPEKIDERLQKLKERFGETAVCELGRGATLGPRTGRPLIVVSVKLNLP